MRELSKKELDKLSISELKYLGIKDSSKKVLVYECISHGIVEQRFDVHIKHNMKCSKCPRIKKLYTQKYINELISKRDIKYDIIFDKDVYGVSDKIKLICTKHGIFEQSIHNHFNIGNNCKMCFNNKRTKLSELAESKLKKMQINVIEYNGTKQCSILNCKEHGKFKSTINNTLKYGCSECNRIKNLNINKLKFIEKAKLKWDNLIKFDYDNIIYNSSKNVKVYSELTGYIKVNGNNFLKGFIPRNSVGELIIKSVLDKNNITYEEQKTFDECKFKNKLRFDFYLPEKNICLEFNGKQHYEPIAFFGGDTRFIEQQRNDKIKVNYCSENDIELIIISYKDSIIEKINKILC